MCFLSIGQKNVIQIRCPRTSALRNFCGVGLLFDE